MASATLSLNFSTDADHTRLRVVRQDPPWRALRAFSNASGEALVHLHNVSGGVLAGDDLRLELVLTPNSQVQVTNIGATRVYRHRDGRSCATHTACFHVGKDALLEYLPEPVIPFANSRFSQTSEIHLADGAGLIWWETISSGRVAHGESFSFESFAANTEIHACQQPIVLERFRLEPTVRAIQSPARLGPFLYSATMYVCRVNAPLRWLDLEAELNEIAGKLSGPEALWGASSLVNHGVVVRGLVHQAHQASVGLRTLWQAAKRSVWGREAALPRKIY